MTRAKVWSARRRLRGWGGVTGMAVACAVTASLTLLPLAHGDGTFGGQNTGQGVTPAVAAEAEECTDPEASLEPSTADGPTIEKIRARGKLIAGVDQNSFRWGYRDPESDTLEGFDIDLVRAIAKDLLGDPEAVVFRAVPTNQRIAALEHDKVDVVVRTMTINCQRLAQVSFSTAYFQAGQQVLAPKESKITGYDGSLAGKRVCTAEGSTAYEALEKQSYGAIFEDEHEGTDRDRDRLTVPNQLDCLVRLQLGEVDAVVTDNADRGAPRAQVPEQLNLSGLWGPAERAERCRWAWRDPSPASRGGPPARSWAGTRRTVRWPGSVRSTRPSRPRSSPWRSMPATGSCGAPT
ncbi:glutamate ABC transporter substrate-binding protein [Kitasatospora cinereorecta]